MSKPDKLWTRIPGPIAGFCCQDAYVSTMRTPEEILHTGDCPNRCRRPVLVLDAHARGLPSAYACAHTRDHAPPCWMPPGVPARRRSFSMTVQM